MEQLPSSKAVIMKLPPNHAAYSVLAGNRADGDLRTPTPRGLFAASTTKEGTFLMDYVGHTHEVASTDAHSRCVPAASQRNPCNPSKANALLHTHHVPLAVLR